MGWDRDQARNVKAQARDLVAELLADRDVANAQALGGAPIGDAPGIATVGVALGLAPVGDGSFELAVRYRADTAEAQMIAQRLTQDVGPGADVRQIGHVLPLGSDGGSFARVQPAAQAQGVTDRVRPLVPGVSVAHVDVTAGTLGAFAVIGEQVGVLSNHHVLVGDDGAVGDAIVQPGPLDGGSAPNDQIGTLSEFVELASSGSNPVDAAFAVLEDVEFTTGYPGGELSGLVGVEGGEQVQKSGRTTGVTDGMVTAIELDGLLVDFGPQGTLQFDGQIEVESTGSGPFSDGGDSGSLVYQSSDMAAVGLLFAGGPRGGSNGLGLTYLNPIDVVLSQLGAQLLADDGASRLGGA